MRKPPHGARVGALLAAPSAWVRRIVGAIGAAGRWAQQAAPLRVAVFAALLAAAANATDLRVEISGAPILFFESAQVEVAGTTDAPPASIAEISIEGVIHPAEIAANGTFRLAWPEALAGGEHAVRVDVRTLDGRTAAAEATLVVQLPGRLQRRPLFVFGERRFALPIESNAGDFSSFTDRWRIVPPPYELDERSRGPLDPYHQNKWKGDLPLRGDDLFINLSLISDTLVEGRTLPTPSGASQARTGHPEFFGREGQSFLNQNVAFSVDLFRGDTAFRPIERRIKATVVANLNDLRVAENGIVNPDVRDGTTRTRGFLALQELFGEARLKTLSPNFDFVSARAGIQPFSSDFRGFVFTDTNFGVRLFGTRSSNREQWNVALFDRLEKDTNSGLNTFERRDQQVLIANFYRQDTFVLGYTAQASIHLLRDAASFEFDKNGFLARPDPTGSFTPHEIRAAYLGLAGLGHVGRFNLDHALYYVFGEDDLNPIAGRDEERGNRVDIRAAMAALEVSIDRDWRRYRLGFFYATGDRRPTDRTARGFDAIFDNPAFAGEGFSFWNRLGIRLAGTGVALVNRGSLLPDLRSSKEEGQPNFVNPGLRLATTGVDLEVTPKLKVIATANYLEFDATETLETLLFQGGIDREIGWDLSVGTRFRPYLNNQAVVVAGLATLLPGRGFKDIYERGGALYSAFVNLTLAY
ncbi:MAG TPA: hypothetical protein VGS22_01295 [Thermoanaerobaculia bacterium]|nr:hypothetical protein [Thermoanaerobaculia bacterium]